MAGLPLQASKNTLLGIIQAACAEIGIAQPANIIGNPDPGIVQLLALANREGREFYSLGKDRGGWQALRKEYVFNAVGTGQLYGDMALGSNVVINIGSTVGITVGMQAVGGYIPVGAYVTAINSLTSITLSQPVTGTYLQNGFYCGQDNYALPSDFDNIINGSVWNRSMRWQMIGPLNAQEWQVYKSGVAPAGPRTSYRIMDNLFYIVPIPNNTPNVFAYEYYSNAWCQSTGGVNGNPQTVFQADTDQYCLDDDCMVLGIIWRYLRSKRLSSDVEKNTYDMRVQRIMSRDGGGRDLALNDRSYGIHLLDWNNIPDQNYGM